MRKRAGQIKLENESDPVCCSSTLSLISTATEEACMANSSCVRPSAQTASHWRIWSSHRPVLDHLRTWGRLLSGKYCYTDKYR